MLEGLVACLIYKNMKVRIERMSAISPNIILRRNEAETAYRIIDGQLLIIHLKSNTFNVLNDVATRIWELIDGKTELYKIMEILYQEFDIDWPSLSRDCLGFIKKMLENKLLKSDYLAEESPSRGRSNGADGELFNTVREKAVANKIPLIVHIDLTYQCNLNCVHCYIVSEDRPILNTNEVAHILEQLAEAGALYLTLSGGEVLLRKDFIEIAQHARKLHFALRILTNGTLIDQEVADKIASLNPEIVAISIYSTKQEVHDRIVNKQNSLIKSISALRMMRDRDTRLKINTVIMSGNVEDYENVYETARKFGAAFQADYRITPKTNGDRTPLVMHVDKKHIFKLLNNPIFTERSEPEPHEVYTGIFNKIPCGAGHMSCYISPYGDVYPCVQLPIKCGNLKEMKFKKIWDNSSALLKYRRLSISDLPNCYQCDLFEHCRICVGLNYVENGDLLAPSKRSCQEAQMMKSLDRKRR